MERKKRSSESQKLSEVLLLQLSSDPCTDIGADAALPEIKGKGKFLVDDVLRFFQHLGLRGGQGLVGVPLVKEQAVDHGQKLRFIPLEKDLIEAGQPILPVTDPAKLLVPGIFNGLVHLRGGKDPAHPPKGPLIVRGDEDRGLRLCQGPEDVIVPGGRHGIEGMGTDALDLADAIDIIVYVIIYFEHLKTPFLLYYSRNSGNNTKAVFAENRRGLFVQSE